MNWINEIKISNQIYSWNIQFRLTTIRYILFLLFTTVIIIVFSIKPLPVFAVKPPLPIEFTGDWIPINEDSQSKNRLKVTQYTFTFMNESEFLNFDIEDICYTCEGGYHYNGIAVWVFPKSDNEGHSPFLVRFNPEEEEGIAILELPADNSIRNDIKEYPRLFDVKFRKIS